jgi:hypothetical protein
MKRYEACTYLREANILPDRINLMKTFLAALLGTLFILCATSAFSQNILSSEVQPLQFASHPQHASQHAMAQESSLFGNSPYTYAKGEVPLAELGSPIYFVPLGDLARAAKKEHAHDRKAEKVFEN